MSKAPRPRIGVFIGRMQPIHLGHFNVLRLMADECDAVIIGIGSANKSRSTKNPFLVHEREQFIHAAILSESLHVKAVFATAQLYDYTYNDEMWLEASANIIESEIDDILPKIAYNMKQKNPEMEVGHITGARPEDCDIVLYGYDQGQDTRYLHQFPQWKKELVGRTVEYHATDIRRKMFFEGDINEWESMVPTGVPEAVWEVLRQENNAILGNLLEEATLVKTIKASKAQYPYPIIDQTVDAVVICNGHVLMVTRGVNPGKGQLALPGGYLNEFETIEEGIIRELKEETRIAIKPSLLRNLLKGSRIKRFAAPGRSVRGRVITDCGLINYQSNVLPEVKGSDDAARAEWIPLTRLDDLATNIFEDHYCIIRNMLGYC